MNDFIIKNSNTFYKSASVSILKQHFEKTKCHISGELFLEQAQWPLISSSVNLICIRHVGGRQNTWAKLTQAGEDKQKKSLLLFTRRGKVVIEWRLRKINTKKSGYSLLFPLFVFILCCSLLHFDTLNCHQKDHLFKCLRVDFLQTKMAPDKKKGPHCWFTGYHRQAGLRGV